MKRRTILFAVIVSTATAATLIAGMLVQQAFTGTEIERVASAKKTGVSRLITLQGRISNFVPSDNVFILTDVTGTAELSTCPTWYRKINIHDGEQVTVTGHILTSKPEAPKALYVVAVHYIERPDGSRIALRESIGKPPWAKGMFKIK
jgi:uncharacterized protein YdeI (BOF family)